MKKNTLVPNFLFTDHFFDSAEDRSREVLYNIG